MCIVGIQIRYMSCMWHACYYDTCHSYYDNIHVPREHACDLSSTSKNQRDLHLRKHYLKSDSRLLLPQLHSKAGKIAPHANLPPFVMNSEWSLRIRPRKLSISLSPWDSGCQNLAGIVCHLACVRCRSWSEHSLERVSQDWSWPWYGVCVCMCICIDCHVACVRCRSCSGHSLERVSLGWSWPWYGVWCMCMYAACIFCHVACERYKRRSGHARERVLLTLIWCMCMYVFMCTYIHRIWTGPKRRVCMYACMYVCMYVWSRVCILYLSCVHPRIWSEHLRDRVTDRYIYNVFSLILWRTYTYTRIYKYTQKKKEFHIYIYVCTCIYIYTHTHTHTHTHKHYIFRTYSVART
jgi:hypothetical protein